jgi:glycerophosphoryl diester phosphodiesterase
VTNRWMRAVVAATLLIALSVGAAPATADPKPGVPDCQVPPATAHRGGSERYTEESLKAYTHIAKYGLLRWEADIRYDKTGRPIIMHDATIDRTTNGTGPIVAIDVTKTRARLNDGSRIPTLEQLLALAADHGASVNLELKAKPTAAQQAKVIDLLDAYGMGGQVLVNSFDAGRLDTFHAAAPDVPIGLVVSGAPPSMPTYDAVFVNVKYLTARRVAGYLAAGVEVHAQPLNDPGQWAPVRRWPLTAMSTDRPMDFNAWRAWVCHGAF